MIFKVMKEVNNYFVHDCEKKAFEIETNGITGDFSNTYLVGMYVMIIGSFLNDGVYKVTNVTSTKLTLDAALTVENTGENICLYSLKVPQEFIMLVDNISTYETNNPSKGITSKSLGKLSISYGKTNTWTDVFKTELDSYRTFFGDTRICCKN